MTATTRIGAALAVAATLFGAASASAQQLDLPRPSPNAKVSQPIGVTEVAVDYSSPGVKNRKIWGGVVPYDKVWRAGANSADQDQLQQGRDHRRQADRRPARTRSSIIPTAAKWTLIFNQRSQAARARSPTTRPTTSCASTSSRSRRRCASGSPTCSRASTTPAARSISSGRSCACRCRSRSRPTSRWRRASRACENGGWSPWANAARYQLEHEELRRRAGAGRQVDRDQGDVAQHCSSRRSCWPRAGNYKEALPLAQKAKELGDKDGENFFLKGDVEAALKTWKTKS